MNKNFFMLKMDKYYYCDALFALEINLHNVRKELISLIEDFEQADCPECLLLKCKCGVKKTKTDDEQSELSAKLCENDNDSLKVAPLAVTLPKPDFDNKEENHNNKEDSPAPSTPEKEFINQDIEAWIEASKKAERKVMKLLSAINPRNSLVTIESVRPADKPVKTSQKANIFNNAAFVTSVNAVDSFFKYFKSPVTSKQTDTKVVYMSTNLAAAYNKQLKQSYSYF